MPTSRILVIDDVSVVRGFVKGALKHMDVRVGEASRGDVALDMLQSMPADVIICDLNMPGMNGEAFVQALRERGDNTPVIMLTVEANRAVVGNLLRLGVQGYLLKPFKPAVLAARVQELLDGTAPPLKPYQPPVEDVAEAAEDAPEEAAAESAESADAAGTPD